MKIKHVVILAGGKGSRLRPYTVVLPKPLMPIGDYSILELIIRQLKKYKFERVTLAVGHKANLIKSFFGNSSSSTNSTKIKEIRRTTEAISLDFTDYGQEHAHRQCVNWVNAIKSMLSVSR